MSSAEIVTHLPSMLSVMKGPSRFRVVGFKTRTVGKLYSIPCKIRTNPYQTCL